MRSWPVYVTVVVLGAGAAVAIAGLPDDTPVDETVRTPTVAAAPSTTRAPGAGAEPTATSESTTTTSTTTTSTTVPPTTVSSTTVPPTTVSTAPSTTAPATESSTSTTTTTTTTPTTTTVTTTTAPPPLVERGDLEVSVANASIFGGLARRTAAELRRLGYDEVVTTNGLEQTDVSVVYHRAGLGREAERLAADLGIGAPVRPLGAAPPVLGGTDDIELLAYLGNDR